MPAPDISTSTRRSDSGAKSSAARWPRPLHYARSFRPRLAWYGVAAMALITAYFTTGNSAFSLFTLNACLLAVFGAVALNLLMGTAGLVSIGNSAFLAVGAFSAAFAVRSGIPFPGDVVFGAVLAGLVGVVIGLPAVRLRGLHLALATLAGFFIITYFTNEYQSKASGGGTGGFSVTPLFTSAGLTGQQKDWAWFLFALVAILVLGATRIAHERSGRAWRMIRDHETVAHTLGIAVTRYKMLAFALSSAVIGFEGGLALHLSGAVTTNEFTLQLAITYIAMVLIGGLDSVAGAVIGAVLVTALPAIVPNLVTGIIGAQSATSDGSAIAEIIYGLLVMVFIMSSPQGIVGLLRALAQAHVTQRVIRQLGRLRRRPFGRPIQSGDECGRSGLESQ